MSQQGANMGLNNYSPNIPWSSKQMDEATEKVNIRYIIKDTYA